MSGTSYVQRAIDVQFTRASGTFSQGGGNSVTVSGLRITTSITTMGAPGMNQMQARIHGITPSMMNDLSTLGMLVLENRRNTVALYAGDAISGMGLVFTGTITNAWADFGSMPDASFDIQAQTGLVEALTPISPASYQNGADVTTIISGIASQMGRGFQNAGVSGIHLSNPYYPGTAIQQIQEVAADAGINWHDDGTTISIWPPGGTLGGAIPLIGPDTGLVGYPKYTANGLDIVTLFNPSINFGGQVQLQSSLPQAQGTWQVFGMVHNLQAQTPGGDWFTALRLVQPGYGPRRLQ
jgi:hypothetical protein